MTVNMVDASYITPYMQSIDRGLSVCRNRTAYITLGSFTNCVYTNFGGSGPILDSKVYGEDFKNEASAFLRPFHSPL